MPLTSSIWQPPQPCCCVMDVICSMCWGGDCSRVESLQTAFLNAISPAVLRLPLKLEMLLPLKRENAAEGLLLLPLKRENAAEGLLLLPLNLENTAKAPHRRPSAGGMTGVTRQDAETAVLGHGWPVTACPRHTAGARAPSSLGEAAVWQGKDLLLTFGAVCQK